MSAPGRPLLAFVHAQRQDPAAHWLQRRRLLQSLLAGAAVVGVRAGFAQSAGAPRIIKLTARRFTYEPAEIALKAGEPVLIAIRSLDFIHGMNLPDLGLRLDLVPGRVTSLPLHPQKPGVIEFVCDNFCGDGHEEMHGRFVVAA
jgi:cytochrome c oxidase subunit II